MKELLINIWIIMKGLGKMFITAMNADLGPIGQVKDVIAAIGGLITLSAIVIRWIRNAD